MPAVNGPDDDHDQHIRVDVFHHFPEGIPVTIDGSVQLDTQGTITVVVTPPAPPPPNKQAVTGHVGFVTNQRSNVSQLTVDSQGNATYQFDDDHDDIVAVPAGDGSGIVVTFASDTPTVASFANAVGVEGTDANGLPIWKAPTTFGVDGSFGLSAVVSNQSAPSSPTTMA